MKLHLLCENAGLFNETQYVFHCPGCSYSHAIRVRGPEPCWGWNGSTEAPTFTPSISFLIGMKSSFFHVANPENHRTENRS